MLWLVYLIVALACIGFVLLLLILALFEPPLEYRLSTQPQPHDGPRFLAVLEALTDSRVHGCTRAEVLTNGEVFYEAQLDAIRKAERNINLEAYIFKRGNVTRRFVDALIERARAGIEVRVVLDAIGCLLTPRSYFRELREAGGQMQWYHPVRFRFLPRLNNRTHRELLIVDGRVGFTGGAGFADHWFKGEGKHPAWRDTMFRLEGDAVASLQATFAENWLEASGEVISGSDFFPERNASANGAALVIDSAPSVGRSSNARMLYQLLLAAAEKCIYITSPYFLPDESARREMVRALRRGVEIKIITPGVRSDHLLTRHSSRRLYGELLQAGAKIYEYQPAMIHTKCMIVDGLWSVIGSTNFDYRSFGINDEINVALRDAEVSARLTQDFMRDLAHSQQITYEQWRHRPWLERLNEQLGWLLERQQ
jgi:cardiolipin synthase